MNCVSACQCGSRQVAMLSRKPEFIVRIHTLPQAHSLVYLYPCVCNNSGMFTRLVELPEAALHFHYQQSTITRYANVQQLAALTPGVSLILNLSALNLASPHRSCARLVFNVVGSLYFSPISMRQPRLGVLPCQSILTAPVQPLLLSFRASVVSSLFSFSLVTLSQVQGSLPRVVSVLDP